MHEHALTAWTIFNRSIAVIVPDNFNRHTTFVFLKAHCKYILITHYTVVSVLSEGLTPLL